MQPRINETRRMDERPLGELFTDLANETSTLFRNEVALAKVEITDKAARLGKNVASLVIGGAVAYAALLAICAAAILLLDMAMPAWLAAVIVGVIVGCISWLLISKAVTNLRQAELKPQETVQSLKEDAQWIKDQIS